MRHRINKIKRKHADELKTIRRAQRALVHGMTVASATFEGLLDIERRNCKAWDADVRDIRRHLRLEAYSLHLEDSED